MADEKYRLVIIKLIQETQKGKMNWAAHSIKNIMLPTEGDVIDNVYVAKYLDKKMRIFRYSYKSYSEDFDTFYITSSVKLQLLGLNDIPDWEFPYDNTLDDLYDTVRFKVAGVKNFIDEVLGLEIIKAEYGTARNKVDITNELSDLITDGRLKIVISNSIGGDPEKGAKKSCKIKYSHQGEIIEKEIPEGNFLDIP